MADLLSVEEAQKRILSAFNPVETEEVATRQSYGRILCEDIHASRDLPAFTSSSMDGFAVKAADVSRASRSAPATLPVVAEIPAGAPPSSTIQNGEAARIMTGAALPEGADAVVPVEGTEMEPGGAVRIFQAVKPGDYIRPFGMDVRQGQTVLPKAHRLRPQDVGLLASLGMNEVPVYRLPRIALLSSGDELVEPGSPLGPGQIYDSNSYILSGLIRQNGGEVLPLGIVRDDPALIKARLESALERKADLIITSAGVSVGDYDYVRTILEQEGRLDWWRVNMRPGKPLAFGAYQETPVVGLPGNPVSAFVGFLLFVVPVLRRLSGRAATALPRMRATLLQEVQSDGRESYLRAHAWQDPDGWKAELTGNQSSGNLYTLAQANALLIVPSGVKSLPIGAGVDLILLDREIG